MTDAQIVALFWERNEQAIRETEEKYGGYCYEISKNILNNHQDVQECLNDTWLQTWNSIPANRPASLKAYVGKIMRNLSLNRMKHNTRKRRGGGEIVLAYEELADMLGQEDTILEKMEKQAFLDFVTAFLDRLSKEDRIIFVRRFWYIERAGTIAKRTGRSEKEVYRRLEQLRRQFREKWEDGERI